MLDRLLGWIAGLLAFEFIVIVSKLNMDYTIRVNSLLHELCKVKHNYTYCVNVLSMREILKQLRSENGYTLKQMAEFLSITPSCYSNYELGYREPNLDTVRKIAIAFDVTTDFLLGLETDYGVKKKETISSNKKCLMAEFNKLSLAEQEEAIQHIKNRH